MITHCRRSLLRITLGLAVALSSPAVALDSEDDLPDQIVVRLVPGGSIDEINDEYGTSTITSMPDLDLYLLDLTSIEDDDALEALLNQDPRVADAEGNARAEGPAQVAGATQSFFFYVPPSMYDDQYAVGMLGLGPAHGVSIGSGVTVALLDSGIDALHPVLIEMVLPGGYNFVDDNEDVADVGNGLDDDADGDVDEMTGHGTAVAGLVAKVAPGVAILPVKVLDSDGAGDTFRTAQGLYYAIEQGVDIINLSLGTPSNNSVLRDAVDAAHAAGIVVVASAGNSNRQHPAQMPAGHEHAIGVAATDPGDVKAGFSNYGAHIGLSAPGVQVVSTVPDGQYGQCDGTSFSGAFVTGTAALALALDPEAVPEQVAAAILDSAEAVDAVNPDHAGLLGTGRLSVAAAVGLERSPADLDGDWVVGIGDFLVLLAAWDQTDSPADLDGDGVVGIGDFLLLLALWG